MRSIFAVSQKSILNFDKFFAFPKYLNSLKNFKHHMASQNDALLYRIYFLLFKSVLGKKVQSEIQIGITFELIGVLRCNFQQSLSHNNFYYLKCLDKLIFSFSVDL